VEDGLKISVESVVATLRAGGAREVYLFGSAASGTMREGSDLDFAVSGLPPEMFYKAIGQAIRAARRNVDLVDLDQDTPFTRYLKQKGVLLRVG
jgi:uncharacterized protein